jgi:hypothetical protein
MAEIEKLKENPEESELADEALDGAAGGWSTKDFIAGATSSGPCINMIFDKSENC